MRFCSLPVRGSKKTNSLEIAQATITELSSGVAIRWWGSLQAGARPVSL